MRFKIHFLVMGKYLSINIRLEDRGDYYWGYLPNEVLFCQSTQLIESIRKILQIIFDKPVRFVTDILSILQG